MPENLIINSYRMPLSYQGEFCSSVRTFFRGFFSFRNTHFEVTLVSKDLLILEEKNNRYPRFQKLLKIILSITLIVPTIAFGVWLINRYYLVNKAIILQSPKDHLPPLQIAYPLQVAFDSSELIEPFNSDATELKNCVNQFNNPMVSLLQIPSTALSGFFDDIENPLTRVQQLFALQNNSKEIVDSFIQTLTSREQTYLKENREQIESKLVGLASTSITEELILSAFSEILRNKDHYFKAAYLHAVNAHAKTLSDQLNIGEDSLRNFVANQFAEFMQDFDNQQRDFNLDFAPEYLIRFMLKVNAQMPNPASYESFNRCMVNTAYEILKDNLFDLPELAACIQQVCGKEALETLQIRLAEHILFDEEEITPADEKEDEAFIRHMKSIQELIDQTSSFKPSFLFLKQLFEKMDSFDEADPILMRSALALIRHHFIDEEKGINLPVLKEIYDPLAARWGAQPLNEISSNINDEIIATILEDGERSFHPSGSQSDLLLAIFTEAFQNGMPSSLSF